jgi:hypothetical protein
MFSRAMTTAVAAALLALACPPPASAGIFQRIFGGFFHHHQAPASLEAYAEPSGDSAPPAALPRRESGPASGYCVRTCDGFHFRVRANAGASAADMCRALCPATQTRLYSGGEIDYATSSDGSRYTDLDTAYLYRQHLVAGCTCNGHDPAGLAHIDATSDPTLRPGDVVVTNNGLMAVTGTKDKVADFTPATDYSGFAKGYRATLSDIVIAPEAHPVGSTVPTQALPQNRSAAK